ncbi:hypothetical protein JZM24_07335 [Candidatus Sodalis endolongispinus]|uniref:Uncharacterized protein n=1 Tax=Candidatus Sodalis endolongispinus TaxID=2812662 RepID=A0ABS5YAH7_9GAMM|nr:ureidoglycolate lyase [Candidatus Sodalis endolongispinus]MBT9431997.1 hypothetical protein [Candidatus Sodalis endolongispinus]
MCHHAVTITEHEGSGLKMMVESDGWFVGIKNWKPENDLHNLDCLERHLLTDEVFILLAGRCTLVIAEKDDNDQLSLRAIPLQPHKVYRVAKSVWHNTITWPGVKLALIENRDTGVANSEFMPLDEHLRAELSAVL